MKFLFTTVIFGLLASAIYAVDDTIQHTDYVFASEKVVGTLTAGQVDEVVYPEQNGQTLADPFVGKDEMLKLNRYSPCCSPDFVFIVDITTGIGFSRYDCEAHIRQFLVETVRRASRKICDQVRVSLIEYGQMGRIRWDFTRYTTVSSIVYALSRYTPGSSLGDVPNAQAGFTGARMVLTEPGRGYRWDSVAWVIWVTKSTPIDPAQLHYYVNTRIKRRAFVISVSVGYNVNFRITKRMATTSSFAFWVADILHLVDKCGEFYFNWCPGYVKTTTTSTTTTTIPDIVTRTTTRPTTTTTCEDTTTRTKPTTTTLPEITTTTTKPTTTTTCETTTTSTIPDITTTTTRRTTTKFTWPTFKTTTTTPRTTTTTCEKTTTTTLPEITTTTTTPTTTTTTTPTTTTTTTPTTTTTTCEKTTTTTLPEITTTTTTPTTTTTTTPTTTTTTTPTTTTTTCEKTTTTPTTTTTTCEKTTTTPTTTTTLPEITTTVTPVPAADICFQCRSRRNHKDLYPDETDCHFYYACFYFNETFAVGIRRPCPDGTFWHDAILQCMPEGDIPCVDPCLDDAVHAKGCYAGNGCRQYFVCANTASYGMCCPIGSRFNFDTCSCDEDVNCNDFCEQEGPDTPTTVEPAQQFNSTFCRDSFGTFISSVPGQPNAYVLIGDDGIPTEVRYCPDGVEFNVVSCRCDIETGITMPTPEIKRQALLWVSCDDNFDDDSINKFATFAYGGVERVATGAAQGAGACRFNNGYISIPGLKTYDMRDRGSWCAFFKCEQGNGFNCEINGGILSNNKDASSQEFTIILGSQPNNAVAARLSFWHPIGIQQVGSPINTPANGWNHVCITYDSNAINLHLNGVIVQTVFTGGYLSVAHCPYVIGTDQGLGNFRGLIDDVLLTSFDMDQDEINAHRTGNRAFLQSRGFFP